jgi:hypothetical protein
LPNAHDAVSNAHAAAQMRELFSADVCVWKKLPLRQRLFCSYGMRTEKPHTLLDTARSLRKTLIAYHFLVHFFFATTLLCCINSQFFVFVNEISS